MLTASTPEKGVPHGFWAPRGLRHPLSPRGMLFTSSLRLEKTLQEKKSYD